MKAVRKPNQWTREKPAIVHLTDQCSRLHGYEAASRNKLVQESMSEKKEGFCAFIFVKNEQREHLFKREEFVK